MSLWGHIVGISDSNVLYWDFGWYFKADAVNVIGVFGACKGGSISQGRHQSWQPFIVNYEETAVLLMVVHWAYSLRNLYLVLERVAKSRYWWTYSVTDAMYYHYDSWCSSGWAGHTPSWCIPVQETRYLAAKYMHGKPVHASQIGSSY